MIVFHIAAEPEGWFVATSAARSGPCLSMALAIEHAERLIEAIRQHGEEAVLEVHQPHPTRSPLSANG
jgi:hypothetical protein